MEHDVSLPEDAVMGAAVTAAVTAAIAHDMNQPLMAISANAGAALRRLRCDPLRLDLLEALLHDIVAQSQRAGHTISAWQACSGHCPSATLDELQAAVQQALRTEAAS